MSTPWNSWWPLSYPITDSLPRTVFSGHHINRNWGVKLKPSGRCGGTFAFGEEGGNLALRHRLAEEVALAQIAAVGLRRLKLLLGLDTLDGGGDAEAPRQADHGLHDGPAILAHQHIADERAVDFDLVEREVPQVGQRRVAGAEIVHRDLHADGAKLMRDRERMG